MTKTIREEYQNGVSLVTEMFLKSENPTNDAYKERYAFNQKVRNTPDLNKRAELLGIDADIFKALIAAEIVRNLS